VQNSIELFLDALTTWAITQPDILAIALVGSHAKGVARPDSDIDIIAIVDDPALYLNAPAWLERFGHVLSIAHEDWGLLQSIRVQYGDGTEVEFGVTVRRWASTDPVDPGTNKVVSNGMRILYDREMLLQSLLTRYSRAT
jgi:predicted nucleotidyltransferase